MESSLGHYARQLTEEEISFLKRDTEVLSDFKRDKLEKEAKKNWDLFFKRNTTHFFKDRHWITREFPELLQAISELDHKRPVLLEAGCGVGNTVFPLLEENSNLFIFACDFSPRAIDFVKAHQAYNESSCRAFVCDLTTDGLADTVLENSVDIVSMIFVLSAVTPEKMVATLRNVYTVMKPGGVLVFRDYALYDHAMLRFSRGHKISENFYMRQDGTRVYYFSEEKLAEVVQAAGYDIMEMGYIQRETINHKEGLCVRRIFLQGKFLKPKSTQDQGTFLEPKSTQDQGKFLKPKSTQDQGTFLKPKSTQNQGTFLKPKSTQDQGKFVEPKSTQKCSEQDSNSSCTT